MTGSFAAARALLDPHEPCFPIDGPRRGLLRMQEAWWKSMILQVTLWSQPYMNAGDF